MRVCELDVEAVSVRFFAVPLHALAPSLQRAPCAACDFVAPAPHCSVMRARMVARGLPDCAGGYVYREVVWEQV